MKKYIAAILCLVFILNPIAALSQELTSNPNSKITNLKKNQEAPFEGVLLNPWAMSEIVARLELDQKRYELKLDFALRKKDAEYRLEIDNLQLSLDSAKIKYEELIEIKDQEIKRLKEIAIPQNDYSSLWFAGGVVGGILLTVLVVWISGEVMTKSILDKNLDVSLQ
jgi:hypothetical protein